jgi:hypothetical protein
MNRISCFVQRLLFVITFTVLLASCKDPMLQEAGDFSTRIMGGTDFDVDKTSSASGPIYLLTVEGASWNAKFTDEDVLSAGALAFFNRIQESSDKWYVRLMVNTQTDVFRRTYANDELRLADSCVDKVSSFFNWKPSMGIDSLRPLIDPLFFPDSLISKIGASVQEQDARDNSFVRSDLVGFDADTIAGIPVIMVKVDAIRKNSRQRYDAFVGAKTQRVLLVVPAED